MPTNDYLPFGTGGGANTIDQPTYAGLAARSAGFVAGTAASAQLNKVWRQSSAVSAMIGQFIADHQSGNVVDDGNIATLEAQFLAALQSALEANSICYVVDSGTADALVGTPNPALVSYVAGQIVLVKKSNTSNTTTTPTINISALGAKTIVRRDATAIVAGDLSSGSDFILAYDGTSFRCVSFTLSDIVSIIGANAPLKLTTRTFYIRTDGSDSNTGLTNTAGGAFQTIDAALVVGLPNYYSPIGTIIIQLGIAGTYVPPANGLITVGSTTIVIQGDPAAPASYIIAGPGPLGGSSFMIGSFGGVAKLIGVTLTNTGSNNSTAGATSGGVLGLNNVIMGATAANTNSHLSSTSNGLVNVTGTLTISGSFGHAFGAFGGGVFQIQGNITFTGNPAFTQTLICQNGGTFIMASGSFAFTGTATGPRYLLDTTGGAATSGSSASSFIPGNLVGTTTSPGYYS